MAHDILVVDDEADIRLLISGLLEDEGYQARLAVDADTALAAVEARRPSLIVLDVWLEGSRVDGIELLAELQEAAPEVPVVMISGHGTIEVAVAAIHAGAFDFIEKPFKVDRLLLVLERAIADARLRRELSELRRRAGADAELIGKSAAIRTIRQAIAKVAPTASRVLITGPSGVGKEVVARQIHMASREAQGPFVVVNCASIAPDTMEIELFGAEGEPNGGQRRIGLFEQAHGGTLLLDEVSDMPIETQAKILRLLQDQSFVRGRRQCHGAGSGAGSGHDQPGPAGRGGCRQLSPGTVLPSGRGADRGAAPERAAGRHSGPGRLFPAAFRPADRAPDRQDCR